MRLESVINAASINNTNNNQISGSYIGNKTNGAGENQQINQQENSLGNNRLSNEKLSEKTIKEAIEDTNKKLELTDRKFEFSVNEETNDIIVKVINKETDEVIREIPSEKILDMVAKMMELAGLFVDERR